MSTRRRQFTQRDITPVYRERRDLTGVKSSNTYSQVGKTFFFTSVPRHVGVVGSGDRTAHAWEINIWM